MVVDAHQHFWKIARGDYFWMDDNVAAIRHDILPEDLMPHAKACGIHATIAVQAAPTVAETDFLLELVEGNSLIKGVVGWVDLESGHAAKELKRLSANPLFKGVRPMLQDIEATDWVLQASVLSNLSIAADFGLSFDALIQPRHLQAIDGLARAVPDLRVVIDHCAKPVIAGGSDAGDVWRRNMAHLASHEQIHCKVSGLANEYGAGWSAKTLQPIVDHVISEFGADRIMWGSDWPVLELEGSYADWFDCAQSMMQQLSDQARAAVFGETASRFYRIDGPGRDNQ
ncbi:amidohydrolase family protein [uncultured Roseibium sp.]|uniref:amidohydrolase family protein n=1 Tax=uncultured Roseibium sp. TaxID=1936171 RepID=UPI0026155136|nr:amidohydrolase family protein [uncultured Roseibium sp.]